MIMGEIFLYFIMIVTMLFILFGLFMFLPDTIKATREVIEELKKVVK
jgi:hypothetical protein